MANLQLIQKALEKKAKKELEEEFDRWWNSRPKAASIKDLHLRTSHNHLLDTDALYHRWRVIYIEKNLIERTEALTKSFMYKVTEAYEELKEYVEPEAGDSK